MHEIPVLTPKYLLQTQWFLFLIPTYSLPLRIEFLFTIHKVSLLDRRGAASLRHRSCVEVTVSVCELKPHPIWFSRRRKSYLVYGEHSLNDYLFPNALN